MLILIMKEEERITLDTPAGTFSILVMERKGQSIRLGVDAPSDWRISRPGWKPRVDKPVS